MFLKKFSYWTCFLINFFCLITDSTFFGLSADWDVSQNLENKIEILQECCQNCRFLTEEDLSLNESKYLESVSNDLSTFLSTPTGFDGNSDQLQLADDPFGNQIALWINHNIVYASTKLREDDWQKTPDVLFSSDEKIEQLRLNIDSKGNALAIWQILPSKSIQSSIRLKDSNWSTATLTHLKETGTDPQIAEGPDGNAIAIWKHVQKNAVKQRLAEFSMQGNFLDNNSSTIADRLDENILGPSLQIIPSDLVNHLTQLQTPLFALSDSLPSTLPFPPTDLRGYQVADEFLTQTDFINVITWKKPVTGLSPVVYKIYRNQSLTDLAAIIPANRKLKFKDHNRKPHHVYAYFIVAVDASGLQSPPIGILFKGTHTHLITPVLPVSITISPINSSIAVGTTQQFFATVTFSDGSTQIVTDASWNSSNPTVATISATGLVTAISPGSTVIQVILGNIAIATTLNVTATCVVPVIATNFLSDGIIDEPYSQTIQTSSGTSPITFSLVDGSLPDGLSLDPITGIISGIPTTIQTSNFTIQATNSCGSSALQPLSITITGCPIIDITTTTLPDEIIGIPYLQQIQTSGGIAPVTFSIVSGSLPDGLILDPATGEISGTPITVQTSNFIIQAVSSCGSSATQSLSITITVCPIINITTTTLPDGAIGNAYVQQIQTSGGVAPVTFSIISGSLPDGLILDPATGEISGTPTTVQTSSFTIQAISSCGSSDIQPLSMTINCPTITITNNTLSNGLISVPYSQQIQTAGGVAPIIFSITSGNLPTGLTLNPFTGIISGTPTAAQTFNFTIQAESSCGSLATKSLSITINCPNINILTTSLPDGTVGTFYSQQVIASGSLAPYNFTISSGSLPTGLILNPSTGVISGTPTTFETSNFIIQVISGCGSSDLQPLSITINCPPIMLVSNLPNGIVGVAYSQPTILAGATSSVNVVVIEGTLPDGLSLDPSTGVISGIPTTSQTFNFAIEATNSCGNLSIQPLSIVVDCPTITIDTSFLPNGFVGNFYSEQILITQTSNSTAPVSFVVLNGSLPDGLDLDSSGLISGTPTTVQTALFTIQVTNSCDNFATQDYAIIIDCPVITIANTSLPDGTAGTFYSVQIETTGGGDPISFSVINGSLPDGLDLDSTTGLISGTPTLGGIYNFEIQATNSCGNFAIQTYNVIIGCPAITIENINLPDGTAGTFYSGQVETTGGIEPLNFSVINGAIPDGLDLDPTTGVISGTPTFGEIYNFTIQAASSCGSLATQAYEVIIVCPVITIQNANLSDGTAGTFYSEQVETAGGIEPLNFSVISGAIPDGLDLDPTTGVISGTPTFGEVYNFTIQAESSCGSLATQAYEVIIDCPLITIQNTSLPDGTAGTFYSEQVETIGGIEPLNFSVISGSIPDGLDLDPITGLISGTPTFGEVYNFTIQAESSCGSVATQAYQVIIDCPLITIQNISLPDGTAGTFYSEQVETAGGIEPLNFSVISGTIPNGLDLDPTTGVVSGNPMLGGTYNFEIQAASSCGSLATQAYQVIIVCPLITIENTSLPDGTVGADYSEPIVTTGGIEPLNFTVITGALPPGLNLNSLTGLISGNPTLGGNYSFQIQAESSCGSLATQTFNLNISN